VRPAYAWGEASDDLDSIRGVPLPIDSEQMTGPQLYDAHCATCHQARGQGSFDGGLPSLFHNTALGRINTDNLVMVMLAGIQRQTDTQNLFMPGFAKQLSDRQIATLGSYLMQRYGNPGAVVTVEQARTLRVGARPSLIVLARMGIAFMFILLVLAVMFALRRR
jgi:mono/diheme cytochrome c family protein